MARSHLMRSRGKTRVAHEYHMFAYSENVSKALKKHFLANISSWTAAAELIQHLANE